MICEIKQLASNFFKNMPESLLKGKFNCRLNMTLIKLKKKIEMYLLRALASNLESGRSGKHCKNGRPKYKLQLHLAS